VSASDGAIKQKAEFKTPPINFKFLKKSLPSFAGTIKNPAFWQRHKRRQKQSKRQTIFEITLQ
jgi:hypothetical protein